MTEELEFDLQAAHKHFAGHCFNQVWDLLDKSERTAAEDEQMIRLALASHWHWTQREDCTETSISVAYWQTSRVYAVLGQGENARRYALLCLEASQGDDIPPFYLGYAFEALARAEMVAGDQAKMNQHLEMARQAAEQVEDADSKQWLLDDLDSIA
jgi:hypothetical protein